MKFRSVGAVSWVPLCLLLLGLVTSSPAEATLVLGLGELGNSWQRAMGIRLQFDEIQLHYRADLDLGGGMFESPYLSDFGFNFDPGMPEPSWSTWAGSSPTVAVGLGNTVSPSFPDFFTWTIHYAGDGNFQSGFNLVFYDQGQWANALEVAFSAISPGFTLANSLNQNEFDPGSVVPEPSSILLLGTGMIGLLGYGWKRRKFAA